VLDDLQDRPGLAGDDRGNRPECSYWAGVFAVGVYRDVQCTVPQLLRSSLSRIGTERRTSG